MAAESSFDVVSKIDHQEVDNAVNQAAKELSQRFDFRGTGSTVGRQGENGLEIRSSSEERANAALEVLKEKLIKRKLSLKILDLPDEPKPSGKEYRLQIGLKEGISTEDAKKISKYIRDEGPKGVKAQVQGDELRVSSKKKDDLQTVQNLVKEKDFDLALQFVNYR
ncbi:YajQ family cyclic di-GMP-binding protein [Nocardiopsis salina]|uniref:YajQ family cyclic di-GMP-binding protein n=1 Tax=Nocardiopsis salina TaxID=245836 RepID=UPI000345788F|nr:YajQ family cyclic di-GMP-binding protein [Nocardiopsis salina]